MKIITQRQLIREFLSTKGWGEWNVDPETVSIADLLAQTDRLDMARFHINQFVRLKCHECGKDVKAAMSLNVENCDVAGMAFCHVCLPCLRAAVAEMEKAT